MDICTYKIVDVKVAACWRVSLPSCATSINFNLNLFVHLSNIPLASSQDKLNSTSIQLLPFLSSQERNKRNILDRLTMFADWKGQKVW